MFEHDYERGRFEIKRRICLNCGFESHLVWNCPPAVKFRRTVANKIWNLRRHHTQNAVHIVMEHL